MGDLIEDLVPSGHLGLVCVLARFGDGTEAAGHCRSLNASEQSDGFLETADSIQQGVNFFL